MLAGDINTSVSKVPLLIAVVDDEEPVRKALNRLLRSAGFGVETFASGDEFLRTLSDHTPDCVVLDLHMPSTSGFEVQQHLTQMPVPVPTVIITGHDSPECRDRALRSGAREFLRKPVDVHQLFEAIQRAIAG